jgi:hypothetical protein
MEVVLPGNRRGCASHGATVDRMFGVQDEILGVSSRGIIAICMPSRTYRKQTVVLYGVPSSAVMSVGACLPKFGGAIHTPTCSNQ